MKFYKLLFLLILLPSWMNAQKITGSLGGFAGFKLVSGMKWKSFDRFTTSYNLYNQAMLKKEFSPLRLKNGFVWGVEGMLGAVGVGYNQMTTSAFSRAEFNNGEARELELKAHQNEFTMDLVYPFDVYANAGIMVGVSMEDGTLKSRYIYKNGFVSYAGDKSYNGDFKLRSTGSIILGLRADAGYKWFKFSFRAENYSDFFGLIKGNSQLIPMYDPLGQSVGGYYFVDGPVNQSLPENLNGNGDAVNSFFRGWCYLFVIRITPLLVMKDK